MSGWIIITLNAIFNSLCHFVQTPHSIIIINCTRQSGTRRVYPSNIKQLFQTSEWPTRTSIYKVCIHVYVSMCVRVCVCVVWELCVYVCEGTKKKCNGLVTIKCMFLIHHHRTLAVAHSILQQLTWTTHSEVGDRGEGELGGLKCFWWRWVTGR